MIALFCTQCGVSLGILITQWLPYRILVFFGIQPSGRSDVTVYKNGLYVGVLDIYWNPERQRKKAIEE